MNQYSLPLCHTGPALEASLAEARPGCWTGDTFWPVAAAPALRPHTHAAAVARQQRDRSVLAFVTLLAMMALAVAA